MSDLRSKIQLARIQDDAWMWGTMVEQLMQADLAEGMKAALSGATRGTPGGQVKERAGELILAHLADFAAIDLKGAIDAASTVAIYSTPDSEIRRQATEFMAGNLERLADIDADMASSNSQFVLNWAQPGSDIEREAARVWDRLQVVHPGEEAEKAYSENEVFGEAMDIDDSARSA